MVWVSVWIAVWVVVGYKCSQYMIEGGADKIMAWADWYMLENAASTEKIIVNWLFLVAAIIFSRWLAKKVTKNE